MDHNPLNWPRLYLAASLVGAAPGLLVLLGVLPQIPDHTLPLHGRASRNGQDGACRRLLTMSLRRRSASALFVVAALLLPGGNVAAQAGGSPASLKWAVAPSLLPPGAMIAVISGNPAGSGRATIALSMPDGYRMPPHFHPSYERVEVKQGLLLVGIGDRLDPKRTLPLAVGDTILAPAGMHHYSIAKGTTIVAVSFIAPYTITYVNAYEAPRQPTSFPYGY